MPKKESYTKKWPRQNLFEIASFLESQHPGGCSLKELSKKMDMTAQAVSQTFIRDDMTLSKAESIAAAYGYRLKLFFPIKDSHGITSAAAMREFPNAGNLAGLARYLRDSNITVNYMSQRIGRSNGVLTRALTTGDIYISTLYEVTRNLKIQVMWKFEKDNGQ